MLAETHVVPSFECVEDLRNALNAKGNFEPIDLYPRDGTRLLGEIEARCADLVGINEAELLLCNSGMAAVITAIETCREQDSIIACSEQSYSQTANYIQNTVARRGNKVVYFDASDITSIDRTLIKHKPDIVLSETVCNGPDTPVLDIDALLELDSFLIANPYLILDNTLPLATTEPLDKVLSAHKKTIGVESGTKSYTFNRELCGLVYSRDRHLFERLQQRRRTTGATPNVAAIERIGSLLPEVSVFDERNMNIFENTGKLALACFDSAHGDTFVSHPVLINHPNREVATKRAEFGNSPVFFLQCTGRQDQFALTEKLWAHPTIREECELGQSFGFDKTRILPDAIFPAVRIAAGAASNTPRLANAFSEVLAA